MPRPWRRRCSPLRWGGLSISRRRSLRDQLPVGLDDLGGVPTMAKKHAGSLALRIKKYRRLAIRRDGERKVYELYLLGIPEEFLISKMVIR